jgi:hypothetical protein
MLDPLLFAFDEHEAVAVGAHGQFPAEVTHNRRTSRRGRRQGNAVPK